MQVINAKATRRGKPVLLVDQLPRWDSLRFRKLRVDDPRDPGHLYVAEQDGLVEFLFQCDPDQSWYGQGFGGRQFHLRLVDGMAETLVGPWSSSTDLVNRYLPELAARDVVLTDDPRRFEDGMVTTIGAITGSLWEELGRRFPAIVADHHTLPLHQAPARRGVTITVNTFNGGQVTGMLTDTHPGLFILTTSDGHTVPIDTLNIDTVRFASRPEQQRDDLDIGHDL